MTDPSNTLRKRAWEAGRDAATAGKAETANRRQQGTIYFDDWLDGFESVRWSACTPRLSDVNAMLRALDALQKIAAYERGGEISPGPTGDRDDMIGLAREALA